MTAATQSSNDAAQRRNRLILAFCIVFLLVQVIVPIMQLPQPRPSRFGWQMFSGYRHIPKYWTVTADGAQHDVNVEELVGVRRLDADYHPALLDHLLRHTPGVVAVRWQWPDSDVIEDSRGAP